MQHIRGIHTKQTTFRITRAFSHWKLTDQHAVESRRSRMESDQRIRSLSMEMQEAVQEQTQLRSGVLQHEGAMHAQAMLHTEALDEKNLALEAQVAAHSDAQAEKDALMAQQTASHTATIAELRVEKSRRVVQHKATSEQQKGVILELRAEKDRLGEEVRALREDGRELSASRTEMTSKVLELELQTVVFPVFRVPVV